MAIIDSKCTKIKIPSSIQVSTIGFAHSFFTIMLESIGSIVPQKCDVASLRVEVGTSAAPSTFSTLLKMSAI
jgi:hypothetical protein